MRIIYHHRTQADGGEGVHISEMITAFQGLGYTVKITALVNKKDKSQEKNNKFWSSIASLSPMIFYEFMELAYNILGYFRLSKTIRTFHPHFIYERYCLHNFAGIMAAKRYNIPLFLEVNSPLAYEKEKYEKLTFKKLARFTEKNIFLQADKIMVVSGVLKGYLLKIGIPEDKIYVVPNGVNIKQLNERYSGEKIRSQYSLNGKTVLSFVGFFKKWHNLEMLLEIFNKIKEKTKNLHLMLIGDGPEQGPLKRYVHNHALQESVTFTGRVNQEEIPKYIAASDVAILPSITAYASPLKIFEYMMMGKAIIAPRQENIEEILTDEENALLFDSNDIQELKQAIFRFASNPELRKRLGNNARRTIFERSYFWEHNAEQVVKIYKKTVQVKKEVFSEVKG